MGGYRYKGYMMLGAVVLAAALAGCTPKVAALTSPSVQVMELATPALLPSASALATATPGPITMPAPTATPQPWTPGPLATLAQPAPTPEAGEVLDFYDYYSVPEGDRQGIVDKYGRIVIPARYAGVKVIDYDMYCDLSTQRLPVRTLFLAVPVTVGDGKDMSRRLGWIVDTRNQRVCEQMFLSANVIGAHLLSVRIWDGDRPRCGVMTDEGKLLLPCRYDYVAAVGSRLVAIDKTADTLELFTSEGTLLTKQTALPYDSSSTVAGGRYWVTQYENQDVLLDENLRRCFTGERFSIQYANNGLFTVGRDGRTCVVDAKGKVVLRSDGGVTYQMDWAAGKGYFLASGAQGAVYDEHLRRLRKVGPCSWLRIEGGTVIVRADEVGRALDISDGHDLTGRNDITNFIGEYFLFGEKDTSQRGVCRRNGEVLPLPDYDSLLMLSPTQFLLMRGDSQGVCDEQGRWIIAPGLATFRESHGETLLAAPANNTSGLCYLMDFNGNRLWQEPANFGYFEGEDAFNVNIGADYGIRDIYGRWLWKASEYQDLQD